MKPAERAETGLTLVVDPLRAEASLWRRSRFEGCVAARETLFTRYLALARAIAGRLARDRRASAADRGDFDQFACEGLLQALDRYDPLAGVPFAAFARRRIAGAIAAGAARLTELGTQFSHRRRVERERIRALAASDAAVDPLAALADLAVGLAIGLMLDGTGIVAANDTADTRPGAYDSLAWRETMALLTAAVDALPDAEAMVIRQHYHHGVPFAEIATLLRLSRGRISQLHRAAIERLRKRIGSRGWTR